VKQVSASLSGAYTEVLIVSTDGVYQKDYRPMVRISVSVIGIDFSKIMIDKIPIIITPATATRG
jgi:predicted Zn-dependent protease